MKKPTKLFRSMNNEELMQYAEQIITKMRASEAVFPEPVPGLGSIETALIAFRLSATEAAHRDSRAIRIRREKRNELEYLLSELAKYVDTIANKDAVSIQTAGFTLSKDAESFTGLVRKAKGVVAEPQQVGSRRIKIKVARWKGARMYRYQFRKKGVETEWSELLSSKSTFVIEGLERFQEYEFRASYLGINPEPNYSDIVASYVV